MAENYSWCDAIDLFVAGRIGREDAKRQARTAREILRRFERQPGLVLADEVGMGKTFVALAVAVSVAIGDREKRPVVVMVPSALKEKWPKDFTVFSEHCISPGVRSQLRVGTAERPVEFLKLLDDPQERQKSIVFVTHGAMSRALFDKWTKLALIYRAIKGRWGGDDLRRRLARYLPTLLRMESMARHWSDDVWIDLLRSDPASWLQRLQRYGIDPDDRDRPEEADDPVPRAVLDILDDLDTSAIYGALEGVPARRSKHLSQRLARVRNSLRDPMQEVWRRAAASLSHRLPLVVLDEAHHLKNPWTKLAGLFQNEESKANADEITRGALGGVFERMLFLTATPFQLGHHELCSVLERFDGIDWNGEAVPGLSRADFAKELGVLRSRLDAAQLAAAKLDHAWGQLRGDDLVVDERIYPDVAAWCDKALEKPHSLTEAGEAVVRSYLEAASRLGDANRALRPWVIRHAKPKELAAGGENSVARRRHLSGRAIVDASNIKGGNEGLQLNEGELFPFLLAARATTCQAESRPVFAEGLASSYEAFLDTRRRTREGNTPIDEDDDRVDSVNIDDATTWYLRQLETLVRRALHADTHEHPKVGATVKKVIDLWRRGEKVLIFCHYIATGRVLRQRISRAIDHEIIRLGAKKLGCSPSSVHDELTAIGDRFFDMDSPIRRAADAELTSLTGQYHVLSGFSETIVDVIRRFLRTPSFLVRFSLLEAGELDALMFSRAMAAQDESGLSLRNLIEGLLEFLAHRCTEEERAHYIEALATVQTGTHRGAEVAGTFSADELQGERTEQLLPNVRLVNGSTKQETRQKLMLTFNTPFYPEVLVSSSVLAEGVDLHLNCRYIIHHDLCWNPSTLEQRTGRVDRIGAKCERARQPIHVYLPYISETQDEKMYRVVMDRERWFQVVMGENYRASARDTDRLAERLPLPKSIVENLALRLGISGRDDVES